MSTEISRIQQAYGRRQETGADERYGMFVPGNMLRLEELHRSIPLLLTPRFGSDLRNARILEVGCGSGYWLRQFIQWGARPENTFGVDLLPERIAQARALCPSAVHLACQDASALSFADGSFDLVLQATVFTSIREFQMKQAIAAEIRRVLKPGGWLLWYDFFVSNPWNDDVRSVGRKEIVNLFPGLHVRLRRLTLAPPIGRFLATVSPSAYELVSGLKVFSTHYLGLIENI